MIILFHILFESYDCTALSSVYGLLPPWASCSEKGRSSCRAALSDPLTSLWGTSCRSIGRRHSRAPEGRFYSANSCLLLIWDLFRLCGGQERHRNALRFTPKPGVQHGSKKSKLLSAIVAVLVALAPKEEEAIRAHQHLFESSSGPPGRQTRLEQRL